VRVVLSERKIQKPIEQPSMIMKETHYPVPVKMNYPTVKRETIINHVPTIKDHTKKKTKRPIAFKIVPPKYKTVHIKPTASTKNDQVHLFIRSFSDSHQEMVKQIDQIKFNHEGLYLPEQDKIFFETVVTKNNLEFFVTSNDNLSEYAKEQLAFTWNKSPLQDINECLYQNISQNNAIGYEIKLKYTSALSLSVDQRLKEKPLREYLDRSRTLGKDEKVIIQFGFQPSEQDWYTLGEKAVKELPKRVKTFSSNAKLSDDGFDCCLRLIVVSKNEHRHDTIARGFLFAMSQLNGDNSLDNKKIKNKNFDNWLEKKVMKRKISSSLMFKNRFILTPKEIGHFIKLPEANLQREFAIEVDQRDEVTVPKSLIGKDGILIGNAEVKGKEIPITLPADNLDDFMKSYVFSGSPRMGKDVGQINLIVESAKKGVSGAFVPDVIDEQGNSRGMADSIRDALPKEKLIDLNLADYFNPIYFGLEDLIEMLGENGLDIMANNLVKIFELNDHATSQTLCRLVAKACKCNLYKMSLFLKSKAYAEEVYEGIVQEDELLAMEIEYEYLDESLNLTQAKNALRVRLEEILGNRHFKHMMAQPPNKNLNFEKWIREGKVVILRMNKLQLGDLGVQLLMYLIVQKLFWIKKIMQTDHCTFLTLNEPHQFMSSALESVLSEMLVECPKYRLSLLIAFHYPSPQFISDNLYQAIKTASINWLLYKNTNMKMYNSIKEQLYPITPEMAMKTERYESIFMPFINGKQEDPFFLKMLPPPSQRQEMYDNKELTLHHSIKYGRPIKYVVEDIKNTELNMYRSMKEAKRREQDEKENKRKKKSK
jgi:hypothetical protein